MKSRFACIVFLLIIVLFIFPITAFADGPAPPVEMRCNMSNIPQNAVYIALLINLPESSPNYVSFNKASGEQYNFSSNASIVNYHDDGYVSYTFHYKNASGGFKLEPDTKGYYSVSLVSDSEQYIEIRGHEPLIKIALLDVSGNILKVSNTANIDYSNGFLFDINYDGLSNQLAADFGSSPWNNIKGLITKVFLILFLMCITLSIEILIAIPFGIRQKWKIILVNICSQIFLNVIWLQIITPYWSALLFGEIIVFAGEFFVYMLIYPHPKKEGNYKILPVSPSVQSKVYTWKRLLIYTIVANFASFAVGLLLSIRIVGS